MQTVNRALVERAIALTNQVAKELDLRSFEDSSNRTRIFELILIRLIDNPNTEGEPTDATQTNRT